MHALILHQVDINSMSFFTVIIIFVGYGRIILAILSCYYMPADYVAAGACYVISGLLDALDGHAARYYNQCM